jgi:hypothetical protein
MGAFDWFVFNSSWHYCHCKDTTDRAYGDAHAWSLLRVEAYTGPAAGCTAVVAVVHGTKLYVANAGDSRCVLCRGKETVSLTQDHKPTNPDEERRIKAAGGFVSDGRINGGLNLSRAIGDMNYKTVRCTAWTSLSVCQHVMTHACCSARMAMA